LRTGKSTAAAALEAQKRLETEADATFQSHFQCKLALMVTEAGFSFEQMEHVS
jgi:hypothetical protein